MYSMKLNIENNANHIFYDFGEEKYISFYHRSFFSKNSEVCCLMLVELCAATHKHVYQTVRLLMKTAELLIFNV